LAQDRTWAFSKDTVYEGQSGTDTMTVDGQKFYFPHTNKVAIVNQGVSPLVLDSLYIERVRADFSGLSFSFATYDSTKNGRLSPTYAGRNNYWGDASCPASGSCATHLSSGLGSIDVQTSRNLYDFSIDVPPSIAKRAVVTAVGDTLCYRMIFTAKNGRGRDTLIVLGTQQYPNPSAISAGSRGAIQSKVKMDRFDIRGRRMESTRRTIIPSAIEVSKE